ncbi:MAG: DUF2336 domain-containing protein [Magnetospiraceae bacterium]
MNEETSRLNNLIELAKETSDARRRQLLSEVTDLFFDTEDSLNGNEIDHFGSIMGKVAFELETKVRQGLAQRMAESGNAPHDLINQLARDEISVAQPVLQNSTVLTDDDLIAIIGESSQEHMMAMTQRKAVSERVSESLVDKGNDTVVEGLVKNDGAKFNKRTFGKMVQRAEGNEQLHAPLAGRKDVPPETLQKMYWFVSAAVRKQILNSTREISEEELTRIMAEMEQEITSKVNQPYDEQTFAAAERYIRNQDVLGNLDGKLLSQLLRQGQVPTFLVGIAFLSKIDPETAHRVFYQGSGEAAAVACRAADIDKDSFANLLTLTDQSHRRSRDEMKKLVEMYEAIPTDAARRAVRYWKLRSKTGGGA